MIGYFSVIGEGDSFINARYQAVEAVNRELKRINLESSEVINVIEEPKWQEDWNRMYVKITLHVYYREL